MAHHWEYLVAEGYGSDGRDNISGVGAVQPEIWMIRECGCGKRRMEGGYTRLKVQAEFFYADDRMVASTELVWLQTTFDTLTGLFYWVVSNKNVWKTVGMVCHPCQSEGYRQMKHIPGGWRGWSGTTRRDRGSGSASPIAGDTWKGGHWLCTDKPISLRWRELQNRG